MNVGISVNSYDVEMQKKTWLYLSLIRKKKNKSELENYSLFLIRFIILKMRNSLEYFIFSYLVKYFALISLACFSFSNGNSSDIYLTEWQTSNEFRSSSAFGTSSGLSSQIEVKFDKIRIYFQSSGIVLDTNSQCVWIAFSIFVKTLWF